MRADPPFDPPSLDHIVPSGKSTAHRPERFVIGPHIKIAGIVEVEGDLTIEGQLEADVRCSDLLIAHDGQVDGVVVADTVQVYGSARGEIYANAVAVMSNARVEAEVYYGSFMLEAGSFFDGRTRKHPDPLSLSPDFSGRR